MKSSAFLPASLELFLGFDGFIVLTEEAASSSKKLCSLTPMILDGG
jgi:hypothetical protein